MTPEPTPSSISSSMKLETSRAAPKNRSSSALAFVSFSSIDSMPVSARIRSQTGRLCHAEKFGGFKILPSR